MCAREKSSRQPRRDGRGPAPLGTALSEALRQLGLVQRLQQARVVLDWPDTVGREIARHTRACSLRRGVLSVQVRTPAWAAQLAFFKADLIARLNQRAQAQIVQDIHWLVGDWPKRPGRRLARRPPLTGLRLRRRPKGANASFH